MNQSTNMVPLGFDKRGELVTPPPPPSHGHESILFDLKWTIVSSIVLCVHRMREGSDVVRIHLLTLHLIFFADGPCIMQTCAITFPLRVETERFLFAYAGRTHTNTKSFLIISTKHTSGAQTRGKKTLFFFFSFFFPTPDWELGMCVAVAGVTRCNTLSSPFLATGNVWLF